jgi:hypothetical protein
VPEAEQRLESLEAQLDLPASPVKVQHLASTKDLPRKAREHEYVFGGFERCGAYGFLLLGGFSLDALLGGRSRISSRPCARCTAVVRQRNWSAEAAVDRRQGTGKSTAPGWLWPRGDSAGDAQ